MLVIGSRALQVYNPMRIPHDWDLLCTREEMDHICRELYCVPVQVNKYVWKTFHRSYGQIEFELTDYSHSGQSYMSVFRRDASTPKSRFVPGWGEAYCATMPILFSIKKSHIFYPKNWEKHIKDYSFLKQIVMFDHYPDITGIRKQELEETQGKLNTPSLDQKTADFFDDNVSNRTFIHDQIHEVMAHRERPMFEYIKIDKDKVACSKKKFDNNLSQSQRIMCVLEEAYVIALERAIIPMLYEGKRYADAKKAFEWAVMRICTTLCSGWFRQFAVDNWQEVINSYDSNYVTKFLTAVEKGQIQRIK